MANNSDDESTYFCKSILYTSVVGIRYWDIAILVPNVIFLLFLCVLFKRARLKLYATNSPVFLTFYGMIWICVVFSVLRSVISMGLTTGHIDPETEVMVDKILWTIVRFLLLTAEISVLVFGIAFGHLESRHSIRAVLITTIFISMVFSVIQGALELLLPSDSFYIEGTKWGVFGHGGVFFLLGTSILFTLLYLGVYALPYTTIGNIVWIPAKRSFYHYALVLFLSCLALTVGCIIVLSRLAFSESGYCVINFVHYLYFSFYIPLVYLTFLNNYCYQPTKIPFSYTMNESMYEDNVNSIESTYLDDNDAFMHRSGSNEAVGGGAIGVAAHNGDPTATNSNNFVLNGPVSGGGKKAHSPENNYHRFLYNANIQSPGSMTGYSSVEESTTATASVHGGSMEFIQPTETK